MRITVAMAVACLSVGLSIADEAHAALRKDTTIPAQGLGSALQHLAKDRDVQLVYRSEVVGDRQTGGAVGQLTLDEALTELLAGSGLTYQYIEDTAVTIVPLLPSSVRRSDRGVQRSDVSPFAASDSPGTRETHDSGTDNSGGLWQRFRLAQVDRASQPASTGNAEPKTLTLEEVIVTAQKREENLQDTPISIVALGSEELEQKGVGSLHDLFNGTVPSLRIVPFGGRSSSVIVGMRGMVPEASQITRDPSVGIYLDGVYLGRVQGLGMELADIERIEVLRGPQGTLFGRNTIGGAVSIVSKRPTGEFGADLKAGIGNRDGRSFAAHVNFPEIANLSVKLDGVYEGRDGWVRNPLTADDVPANYSIGGKRYSFGDVNHDFGEVERYGFRVSTLFRPAENLSLLYAFDWSRDNSTGTYPHIGATTQQDIPPLYAPLDTGRRSVARTAAPLLPSTARTEGHSLSAEWDINEALTLRSISAWRKLDGDQWDQDGGGNSAWNSSAQGRASFANVRQTQFSEELQLIGDVGDLEFVVGAYIFREDAEDTQTTFRTLIFNGTKTATTLLNPAITGNVVGGVPNQLQDRAAEASVDSEALFGQATWSPAALDRRLHLTVGGRYTQDSKDGRILFLRGAPQTTLSFVFESSRFDPMANIAYDLSDDVNVYVKYGTAYRSGGANTRSLTLRSFGEEELTSWELGLKADLFDRRARFNVAAYTSRLKNGQIDFADPLNISATETLNVTSGVLRVRGIESDVTIVPAQGITLAANYVFTDYNQRRIVNPFTNLTELLNTPLTPRHAFSASVNFDFGETAIGRPQLYIDAHNVGGYFSAGPPTSDPAQNAKTWLVNGRLSLSEIPMAGGNFEIAVWGRNLTNRTYQQSDFIVGNANGANTVVWFNEPRTFGVETRVRF